MVRVLIGLLLFEFPIFFHLPHKRCIVPPQGWKIVALAWLLALCLFRQFLLLLLTVSLWPDAAD